MAHHLYFLSRSPHPPSPTLFPYTTLFRSGSAIEGGPAGAPREVADSPTRSRIASPSPPATMRGRLRLPDARIEPGVIGDRKSTRLNSSHITISYAVFCLKKKTNTRQKQIT